MAEFKPADVYVGVIELFSVLLPGAFLLEGVILAKVFPIPPELAGDDVAGWVAFVLSAYALGAIVFQAASLLDESFYDAYRKIRWPRERDHAYQLATRLRLAFFGQSEPSAADEPARLGARILKAFGWPPDSPEQREAKRIARLKGDDPMNTFAWAKSVLVLSAPTAFSDVQRYEAESKFFRSLIVVLLLVAGLAWWRGHPEAAPVALVLVVLSFGRYAERRQKSTEWAYRYVIALRFGAKPAAAAAEKPE